MRNYINTFGEIPKNFISKLIEALESSKVATSAYQIALTIGCIGCSKPDREVIKEIGVIPLHDIDFSLCHNCSGGFMRIENADELIPTLVKNLNRPKYKDRNRKVRFACAIALGEIAYTNPKSVITTLQLLHNIINEEKGRKAVIFALGCIGYTRPDLIEKYSQQFEKVCNAGYTDISMACRSALKKIGKETNWLLNSTISNKKNLNTTMDIFFERMKKYKGRLVGESIYAIRELARKFPDEVITILNKKLENSTGFLHEGICIVIELISEEFHYKMKDTIPLLIALFENKFGHSYQSLDSSAAALTRIFSNHPELIPEDLEKILTIFMKYEKRNSVIYHTKILLEEIRNNGAT